MPYIGAGIQRFNTADGLTVNGNAEVTGTTALTGAITSSAGATITTDDNNPQLILKSRDADANTGPEIELFRDSASPAADDGLGQIQFKGRNAAAEELIYGEIDTAITDPTDGSEDSEMRFLVKRNGDTRAALILEPTESVFNDAGIDADFRVESDNDANAFFVQGSDGNVGIGVAAPTSQLTIGGNTNTTAKPTVQITDTTAGASLVMRGQSPKLSFDITSGGVPKVLLDGAGIEFKDGTLDAEGNVDVKIDGSGNLLVGKTTSNSTDVGANIRADKSFFTSDGQEALVLNRNSDLGKIIEFRDDNSLVGSIGARSTSNLFISFRTEANTDGCGLSGSGSSTGAIIPTDGDGQPINDHIDFGTSTNFFDDIFATGGVTTSSDQNKKQDVASLTSAEITAAKAISKLFKTFKWKHRVAEKGDAARTHTGVIAQEVQTAMTDAGLDAAHYAFWCSNTWWEKEETYTNDDGKERTRIDTYDTAEEAPEGATQRTQLSIRYAELLAFIGAATEQRLADIETRLTALEDA